MVFVLVTGEGLAREVDQIVETKAIANREAKDLRAMGCIVTIKAFPSWEEAEAYEAKIRGW